MVQATRFSLLCTILFAMNLASTPLEAYFTEPWPWSIRDVGLTSNSFDAFENATAAYLHSLYNATTMADDVTCVRDRPTNTYAARFIMPLSFHVAPDDCFGQLVHVPGAYFYGPGLKRFMCSVLAAPNATARSDLPSSRCQHFLLASLPLVDVCAWFDPRRSDGNYDVYYGTVVLESAAWAWSKLVYRVVLTLYIGLVLWRDYYRHYIPLFANLRDLGIITPTSCHYDVVFGDPTCIVSSNVVISFGLYVDTLFGAGYMGVAILGVTQFHSVRLFVCGCLYCGRTVVCGLLAMQLVSIYVNRYGNKAAFASVDPAILTIAANVYGGSFIILCAMTPVMVLFHQLWSWLIPTNLAYEAVDCLPSMLSSALALASVPIGCSCAMQGWAARQQRHHKKAFTLDRYGHASFNDMKMKVVHWLDKASSLSVDGGSVYRLYDANPR
ncbi:hypothetical protein As57867_011233, partial [Aphanomyces stellatus]